VRTTQNGTKHSYFSSRNVGWDCRWG